MKIKLLLCAVVLACGLSTSTQAQNMKIAYCKIEVLLRLMPETAAMEQELNTYRQKYSESLAAKEKVGQDKYTELMELMSQNPPALTEPEAKKREEEIMKIQDELKTDAAKYEKQLLERQERLMSPITDKLQKALDDIAKEDGYTYVLNAMDAGGTSIVLVGPKEYDITEKTAKRLNIVLPSATTATPPAGGGR